MTNQDQDKGYIKYYTIENISAYLNIRRKTLYVLVESGRIPFYRIGRSIRFRMEEIDDWMQQQRFIINPVSPQRKLTSQRNPISEVEWMVRKTIDRLKHGGYTSGHGKPDRIKGLGKEVP